MSNLTPISGFLGGALIGLSAALLMLLLGRIAGIGGVFSGLFQRGGITDKGWRLAFILGLIVAPVLAASFGHSLPKPQMPASWLVIAVAGVLVGVGSRLAGGCTSGHGVCGIARFSLRSTVATAIFMAAAFVTVAVMRHGFGG